MCQWWICILQLETEHEQIFPFNPLYTVAVPTAPLANLDLEMSMAIEQEKCKLSNLSTITHDETKKQ